MNSAPATEETRVTVDEVKERMDRGEPFTFIDARNPEAWGEAESKLPGAIRIPVDDLDQHLTEIPHDRAVIVYCTCPHEASAADVAVKLIDAGRKSVHPLFGGFDAWVAAGLPVEQK